MPGKKYKSIGIREKLYERIEEEKKEGESISDYIERVIDMATERKEVKKIESGLTKKDLKQALLGLENDIDLKIRDMLNEVMKRL